MTQTIKTQALSTGETIAARFENSQSVTVVGKNLLEKNVGAWSPVHMLLSAVETCFLVTFRMIAERAHVGIGSIKSEATGTIDSTDGKHFAITAIQIRPTVQLLNAQDNHKLSDLYKKAEEYCVVGHSLNLKVEVVS